MKNIIVEAHRRSIWQVLGIYLVGCWIAYEVTLAIVQGLGLPDWVPAFAVIILILGLPLVLATAFVQEGLPGARAPEAPEEAPSTSAAAPRAPSPATDRAAPSGLLTWRGAATAGVLAFAALGLGVAGFVGMRALGVGPFGSLAARGELGDNGVLLAEFRTLAGDSLLARMVTEAVQVDLSQSGVLHAADRARVNYGLARMGKPENTPLDEAVARELAVRLGMPAIITGDVARASGEYLLSARVETADSGRVLVALRESARDSTQLLTAIDRLSRKLRERAGESLKTIRASPPLEQVTTPSLPALRAYMRAKRARDDGKTRDAVQLLNEALSYDPNFAAAHLTMGVLLRNAGRRGDTMLFHLRAAVQQEQHLTEIERHRARGMLYMLTGRLDDARREYEELLAVDSADASGLINMGVVHGRQKQWAQGIDYYRRAIATGYKVIGVTYWNIWVSQLQLGDHAGARSTLREAAAEYPKSPIVAYMRVQQALTDGDYAAAETLAVALSSRAGSSKMRMMLAAARGQLARAQTVAAQAPGAANPLGKAYNEVVRSYLDLWVARQPRAAIQRLRAALFDAALDQVPAGDRPDPYAALALAAAGDAGAAQQLITRFQSGLPAELLPEYEAALLAARGFVQLDEGKADSAIATLTRAQEVADCQACLEALRGQVLETAGMRDSALVAYERYINTGWSDRFDFFPNLLPNDVALLAPAHEHAAALAEQRGDRERARSHYASFVNQWQNADAELQPRVRAARQRLIALTAEVAR